MTRAIVAVIAAGAACGLFGLASACSSTGSSSGSSGSGADGGNGGGEAGSGDGSAAADAADAAPAAPVNGCKTFDDRTAPGASRTITWGFPLSAADRCIAIKVGQSVTWSGNFQTYRVGPSGGDKPNPIAGFDPTAPTVKFAVAGTFGFESPDAPALVGAILVSP